MNSLLTSIETHLSILGTSETLPGDTAAFIVLPIVLLILAACYFIPTGKEQKM